MKIKNLKSIAFRFMLQGTEEGRFSPTTLFAWVAIAIGVAAMGSLLSVMYGFETTLRERVLKAYPHVFIRPPGDEKLIEDYLPIQEKILKIKSVKRSTPYLESEMIVQSRNRTLAGVVWGLPQEDFKYLKPNIQKGTVVQKANIPQVVMGIELVGRLGLSIGSRFQIISPIETGGAFGVVPKEQTYELVGIYSSGHYDFDNQYLFILLEEAQTLLEVEKGISGWQVWGEDYEGSREVEQDISNLLGKKMKIESWEVFNSALFHSLKLEQYAMFIILSLAIAIAVLNIVITLMMHVQHKKKNIGILVALGATQKQIKKIFLWQGLWVGIVGLVMGAILTVLILLYIKFFSSYELPDIYYDRTVPIEIRSGSMVAIYFVAMVMIYLATLLPARRAAKTNPIEAIRE
jgi:lipoprotein-releasing system permease protein